MCHAHRALQSSPAVSVMSQRRATRQQWMRHAHRHQVNVLQNARRKPATISCGSMGSSEQACKMQPAACAAAPGSSNRPPRDAQVRLLWRGRHKTDTRLTQTRQRNRYNYGDDHHCYIGDYVGKHCCHLHVDSDLAVTGLGTVSQGSCCRPCWPCVCSSSASASGHRLGRRTCLSHPCQ